MSHDVQEASCHASLMLFYVHGYSRGYPESIDGQILRQPSGGYQSHGSYIGSCRLAPSAKNRQAWRFVAVGKEDSKKVLKEACYGDERVMNAGYVVAACTTNIRYTMPNGQPSHPLDLAFAVSFMCLQAEHEGLGTAILGTYDERTVKDLLTVPHAMQVVLLLAVGHRADEPGFQERLLSDRVISYDHW
jgi:nitroreductase